MNIISTDTHVCVCEKNLSCCFYKNLKLLTIALYFSDPVQFCRTGIKICCRKASKFTSSTGSRKVNLAIL